VFIYVKGICTISLYACIIPSNLSCLTFIYEKMTKEKTVKIYLAPLYVLQFMKYFLINKMLQTINKRLDLWAYKIQLILWKVNMQEI
jgi:uncharacterized protein YqkB